MSIENSDDFGVRVGDLDRLGHPVNNDADWEQVGHDRSGLMLIWPLLIGAGLLFGLLGGAVVTWRQFGDTSPSPMATPVFSTDIDLRNSGDQRAESAITPTTPSLADGEAISYSTPLSASGTSNPPTSIEPIAAVENNLSSPVNSSRVVPNGAFDVAPNYRRAKALAPAPLSGLVEGAPEGQLPVISLSGEKPRSVYAQEFVNDGRKRIAVILVNMGLSAPVTEAAIYKTAPEVTLAFSPYGVQAEALARKGREQGHETILMVPQEPVRLEINNPGPLALSTWLDDSENMSRLRRIMAVMTGYVGLMESMGSRYATDTEHVTRLLKETKSRGLLYVDTKAAPESKVAELAISLEVAHVRVDLKLDANPSRQAIDKALADLMALADRRGQAVAMARPLPSTIERLSEWSRSLDASRFVLAPISAMVDEE